MSCSIKESAMFKSVCDLDSCNTFATIAAALRYIQKVPKIDNSSLDSS